MEISAALIDHIAALARLELGAEEREAMREHLGRILEAVNKLNEVSATADPHPTAWDGAFFRYDALEPSLAAEAALANAPLAMDGGFAVPKVLN